MNRLHYINLVGVLAVAALCIVQWRINRSLNLEVGRLDRVRQEQENKLADQERMGKGLSQDLEGFKVQILKLGEDVREKSSKLSAAERQIQQLERDRDQLKQSVTNWAKAFEERDQRYKNETLALQQSVTNWSRAVTLRDDRLKEANQRIQSLGDQLNANAAKYNQLATNYNDAVQRLNSLTSNYNVVVKQLNEARGAK